VTSYRDSLQTGAAIHSGKLAPSDSRAVLVVALLTILICVPWLERPFHTRGEPREALVSQAMLYTGNWISPPAYDGAVPSKPPFSHWLISLASLPRGYVTEATARLPSALAFVGLVVGFCIFVSRRISTPAAVAASLILLSTSEWFRAASTCRVDTILAASMAGALFALFAWWERGYKGIPFLAIALTSCATLTKGPVGCVLPLSIFSLFCWLRAGCRLRALGGIVGRALMISFPVMVLTGIWYVLGYLARGDEFIEKVMYENVQRFAGTMADEPHRHSIWYLFGMLALGILPWTIPLLRVLVRRTTWRDVSLQRIKDFAPLVQFSLLTAGVIILFFCIPSSKRSVYLLPAYPYIAILLGQVFQKYEQPVRGTLRMLSLATYGIALLLLAIASVMYCTPLFAVSLSISALLESFTPLKIISLVVVSALLVLPLTDSFRQVCRTPVGQLAVAILGAITVVSGLVYDTIAWQLSPKRWVFSQGFVAQVAPGMHDRLYSFGTEAYGASFYLQKPFSRIHAGNIKDGAVVFLEARKKDELAKTLSTSMRELYRYSSGLENPKKDVLVVQLQGVAPEQVPSHAGNVGSSHSAP
jgi:4-amino-4-deoxy-L-arabinose transferase-like glycosyltransferase